MSKPRLLAERDLKSLEDSVALIREAFERGLDHRNTGARISELNAWATVRRAITSAEEDLIALRSQLP